MPRAEIQPGIDYALRERRLVGAPFQCVRVLEHIQKNRWKAKWIEPNPGLIDFVESGQLIVPWKEHELFLKEEESEQRLENHNLQLGYKEHSPMARAMYEIYESVGDEVSFYKGTLRCSPEALERLKIRAKADQGSNSPITYTDRQGKVHVPFDEALQLGREFCAAEPATVLAGVEATERKWLTSLKRFSPTRHYCCDGPSCRKQDRERYVFFGVCRRDLNSEVFQEGRWPSGRM